MSKAVKFEMYKKKAERVVMYGRETWAVTEMDLQKTEYMGEENIKDTWTAVGARNMGNENYTGTEGAM
jgi:hypothetical protein